MTLMICVLILSSCHDPTIAKRWIFKWGEIFFVIKKEDSCILEIWNNQDKLDFIDENYIKNYTNKLKNNEYLMDLETLVTIYVKDYKKYDYKLISMENVNVIR